MSDYTSTNPKKIEVQEGWQKYVCDFAQWTSFITLTSREIVTRDQIEHKFRWLVRRLNKELFGNNYTRIVGHSYFSYVIGLEHQKRDVLHAHVLVDRKVNFEAIHQIWNSMSGFAHIVPVTDSAGAAGYLSKYVSKGGDLSLYKPAKVKEPRWKPWWYIGL